MATIKKYWFRAKQPGNAWGWRHPITWQGWAAVIAYLALVIAGFAGVAAHWPDLFVPYMIAIAAAGFCIRFWKSEPQHKKAGQDACH